MDWAVEKTQPSSPEEWEYRDFVHSWAHRTWCADPVLSRAEIQDLVWEASQSEITLEMTKMLDEGWQPLEEVGPARIKITSFTDRRTLGCFLALLAVLQTPSNPLFQFTRVEPTEFRVKMRRLKKVAAEATAPNPSLRRSASDGRLAVVDARATGTPPRPLQTDRRKVFVALLTASIAIDIALIFGAVLASLFFRWPSITSALLCFGPSDPPSDYLGDIGSGHHD